MCFERKFTNYFKKILMLQTCKSYDNISLTEKNLLIMKKIYLKIEADHMMF